MNGRLTRLARWLPLLLLLAPLIAGPPAAVGASAGPGDYVDNQLVVRLSPLYAGTIDAINADYGTTTLDQLGAVAFLLQAPAGGDVHDLIDAMGLDPRLAYAELNLLGQSPENSGQDVWAWGGGNSAPYGDQYALDMLRVPEAQALAQGGGTIVAVLDTGVQLAHPELAGSLLPGYDYVDGDALPDDSFNGLDDDGDGLVDEAAGHGTHVAGIVHLVAPAAQILPLRVLNSDGRGDTFLLARAVLAAAAQGADVINLSLGLPEKSRLLRDAIRYVTAQGTLVVAAAGNLNSQQRAYPAATQCVLSVTAVGPGGVRSAFASYGSWVSLAAPGESIYSAFPDAGYAWWSGTSMAAPFVAGQAALLRSLDSSVNPRQLAQLIASTARPVDAANPGFRGKLGAGYPDMAASLEQLLSGILPSSNHGIMSGSCIE